MGKTLARARTDELLFRSFWHNETKRKRIDRLAQSITAYVAQVLNTEFEQEIFYGQFIVSKQIGLLTASHLWINTALPTSMCRHDVHVQAQMCENGSSVSKKLKTERNAQRMYCNKSLLQARKSFSQF